MIDSRYNFKMLKVGTWYDTREWVYLSNLNLYVLFINGIGFIGVVAEVVIVVVKVVRVVVWLCIIC